MNQVARYRELTTVFIAVYSLAPDQRKVLLPRLCVAYPELRRDIEELLFFRDRWHAGLRRKRRLVLESGWDCWSRH